MVKQCILCGIEQEFKREIKIDFKCQKCHQKEYREKNKEEIQRKQREQKKNKKSELSKDLIDRVKEFVNKIERQKGFATTEEIFVDLISIYYDIPKSQNEAITIDKLPVNKQLSLMWNKLKIVSSNKLSPTNDM